MNNEKELLKYAIGEVKGLRRDNELMRARLSGFEDALLLFKTPPVFPGGGMMHPDVLYEMEKRVAVIENLEKREDKEDQAYVESDLTTGKKR